MINVDDRAEIRRLYFAEKMGMKSISRQLGIARSTGARQRVLGGRPVFSGRFYVLVVA